MRTGAKGTCTGPRVTTVASGPLCPLTIPGPTLLRWFVTKGGAFAWPGPGHDCREGHKNRKPGALGPAQSASQRETAVGHRPTGVGWPLRVG